KLPLKALTSAGTKIRGAYTVTDANSGEAFDNNIVSQLLLCGNLKGYINNPAYYFRSDSDSASYYLDEVMLTNGWSRYNWQDVLSANLPKLNYPRDSDYLSVHGQVEGLSDNRLKKGAAVSLSFIYNDRTNATQTVPIDQKGNFYLKNLFFFDSTRVYYDLKGITLTQNNKITITTNLYHTRPATVLRYRPAKNDSSVFSIARPPANDYSKLEALKKGLTLDDVKVVGIKKTRIQELNAKYTRGIFSGAEANSYSLDFENEKVAVSDILTYLKIKIPEIIISNPYTPDAYVSWVAADRASDAATGMNEPHPATLFFVDEIETPLDNIIFMDVNNIAFIKVFKPMFWGMGANGGTAGAVSIYTKKGFDKEEKMKEMQLQAFEGYSAIKEFYVPNRAENEVVNRTKDLRTTLLWNPRIMTDQQSQKVKIDFNNNDITRSFRITIEGMDLAGRLYYYSNIAQ
ncbi:MAG TPA: hypothetical protein PKM63_15315, partial [Panacibacter sp.]|nr:hypothetical protein [Panacibacter sp.]HNP45659.1 hypothetical protein [Panacibacter sp.]